MPNPYNFRHAVRAPADLVGRMRELHQIEEYLESTANGSPVHVGLIGPRGIGKTSLLNVTESRARESRLLPIRVDLDAEVVTSPLTLFRNIYEGIISSLLGEGILADDDERVLAWKYQTLAGIVDESHPSPFDFGILLATAIERSDLALDVPTALVVRDFRRLLSEVAAHDFAGLAILIDEGDLLGHVPAILQKLRNFAQSFDTVMILASGTERMFDDIAEYFSPIPRQFARIAVREFTDILSIRNCVEVPLGDGLDPRRRPSHEFLLEVRDLTGGRPYEIKLVCHYVWREMERGALSTFSLTQSVLDTVLGELVQVSEHVATEGVKQIRELSLNDITDAAAVVPYQGMSVKEIALIQLYASEYTDDNYQRAAQRTEELLSYLKRLGIIKFDGSTFEFTGGDFAAIYFRYAIAARLDRAIKFESSYPRAISTRIVGELLAALPTIVADTYSVVGLRARQYEVASAKVGRAIDELEVGVRTPDILRIVNSEVVALYGRPIGGDDTTLVSFLSALTTGLDTLAISFNVIVEVECTDVVILLEGNELSAHHESIGDGVQTWLRERAARYEQYRANPSASRTVLVPADLMSAVLLFMNRTAIASNGISMLEEVQSGATSHQSVIRLLARLHELVSSPLTGPEAQFADSFLQSLYNALGFFECLAGNFDAALEHHMRAYTAGSAFFVAHNIAYCYARLGDMDNALVWQVAAIGQATRDRSGTMLMFFPAVAGFSTSRYSEAVPFDDLQIAVEVQLATYRAATKQLSSAEYAETIRAITPTPLAPASRVYSWAWLAVFDDQARAVEQANLAMTTDDALQRAAVERELDFMTRAGKNS